MSVGESAGDCRRQPGRARGRDPERHDPRDRPVQRRARWRDGPRRRRALLALSVSQGLMRDAALLARDKGVMLHTHLAEDADDVAFSLARFGCRPDNMSRAGLDRAGRVARALRSAQRAGNRPVLAHTHRRRALPLFELPARFGHRAAEADVRARRAARHRRRRIGLKRQRNLLLEARQAMLLQRAIGGPAAFDPRDALFLVTRAAPSCSAATIADR